MTRVIRVQALPGYRLALWFDDGTEGQVDLASRLRHGVFQRLRNPVEFSRVSVGEFGEVRWGDDLDLDPDALRAAVLEYSSHA
jgi:hypothetical protein